MLGIYQGMKKLNIEDKALVVISGKNENVQKSARNLADVRTSSVATLNVFDLLKFRVPIVTDKRVDSAKNKEEAEADYKNQLHLITIY